MSMPQEITNATRADEPAAVPANTNTRQVADVHVVLELINQFEKALSEGKENNGFPGLKAQVAAAGFEVVSRAPDAKPEITGAPAVILQRNRKVPGKDIIYMDALNHRLVGRSLNICTMPENLGVMTPDEAMIKIPSLKASKDGYGYDGLDIKPSPDYEREVFKRWKDRTGLNKWVAMPFVVLTGKDYFGEEKYFDGNLCDNWNKGDLAKATVTSGTGRAKYFGSGTPLRDYPDDCVLVARPKLGVDSYALRRYGSVSWLPCLAQELTL